MIQQKTKKKKIKKRENQTTLTPTPLIPLLSQEKKRLHQREKENGFPSLLYFLCGSVQLTNSAPVSFPVFPVWVKIAIGTVVFMLKAHPALCHYTHPFTSFLLGVYAYAAVPLHAHSHLHLMGVCSIRAPHRLATPVEGSCTSMYKTSPAPPHVTHFSQISHIFLKQ